MDLKSRFKALCNHLGLSIREFERECQLNRGNISNITGAIGSDKIAKIATRFPEVDIYWLLTGKGSMLRFQDDITRCEEVPTPSERETKSAQHETICLLKEEIELLKEQIHLQRKQISQVNEVMGWIKKHSKFL